MLRPTNIHGFIIKNPETKSSYNIIENARLHIKSKYVLTIDLQNFFSSITGKRVYSLFSSGLFDFSDESAKALTFSLLKELFQYYPCIPKLHLKVFRIAYFALAHIFISIDLISFLYFSFT